MDQANADARRRKWKPIWEGANMEAPEINGSQVMEEAIDKEGGTDDSSTMKQRVNEFRASVAAFKRHTAMSHDNLKPHLPMHLSDEAIETLLKLYDICEREGRWPEQWRHPCLVCIPKEKEGEFRLIALLHFAYRAWAKNAARGVSKWLAARDLESSFWAWVRRGGCGI